MKNTITFTALGLAAVVANGQDFIAGFDFTNQNGSGDVGVYSADVASGIQNVTIDTSAFIQSSDFGGAGVAAEGRQVGFDDVGNVPTLGDFDYNNGFSSDPFGLFFQAAIDGLSFTVNIDTSGYDSIFFGYDSFSDDTAVQTGGEWFTSFDSGSNVSLDEVTFTSAWSANSYNIDTTGVDSLALTFTFASLEADTFGAAVTGQRVHFDNFAIGGTPIPEPSTFAALAGVVALASAVARRRKS